MTSFCLCMTWACPAFIFHSMHIDTMMRLNSAIVFALIIGGGATNSKTKSGIGPLPTVDLGYAVHQATFNVSFLRRFPLCFRRSGITATSASKTARTWQFMPFNMC